MTDLERVLSLSREQIGTVDNSVLTPQASGYTIE